MSGFVSDSEKAGAVEARTGCWPGHFLTNDPSKALCLGNAVAHNLATLGCLGVALHESSFTNTNSLKYNHLTLG